jgi:hypothetical protein
MAATSETSSVRVQDLHPILESDVRNHTTTPDITFISNLYRYNDVVARRFIAIPNLSHDAPLVVTFGLPHQANPGGLEQHYGRAIYDKNGQLAEVHTGTHFAGYLQTDKSNYGIKIPGEDALSSDQERIRFANENVKIDAVRINEPDFISVFIQLKDNQAIKQIRAAKTISAAEIGSRSHVAIDQSQDTLASWQEIPDMIDVSMSVFPASFPVSDLLNKNLQDDIFLTENFLDRPEDILISIK